MTTRDTINDLFLRARALDGAARDAFVEHACTGDPALLAEVVAMLRADAASASALLPPTHARVAGWAGAADARLGDVVAGCRLTRLIAQGGMGVVYEAEQAEPRRRVAVKMLRTSLQGKDDALRFRHEARIIGRLRHPGIAQVYAAGTAEDGTPYLILELIPEARDLLSFAQDLPRPKQIELLIAVCDAVQFGHGQGVIHRDLKPSNVIVGPNGQPRLIDFGIARLTDDDEAGQTVQALTRSGTIFGTLGYVSPEQIAGGSHMADARSDVYALGVILYRLVTEGRSPYGDEETSDFELAKRILDQKPAPSGAPGDVDLIVQKALRKRPEDRYQSADAFAADLRRCLASEPIAARPLSVPYQMRMFARRHRVGVALGALAILGLAATTVWSVIASGREETARIAAEHETERARGMLLESQRLVTNIMSTHEPALRRVPGTLAARVELGDIVQRNLENLALFAKGDPRLRLVAARHYVRLGSWNARSLGRHALGRSLVARAEELLQQLRVERPDDPELMLVGALIASEMAWWPAFAGRSEDALALLKQAVASLDRAPVSIASDRVRVVVETEWARVQGAADSVGATRRVQAARAIAERHLLSGVPVRAAWLGLILSALLVEADLRIGDAGSSSALLERAQETLQTISEEAPPEHVFHRERGRLLNSRMHWARHQGEVETSVDYSERSIREFREAYVLEPKNLGVMQDLAHALNNSIDARMQFARLLPDDASVQGEHVFRQYNIAIKNAQHAADLLDELLKVSPNFFTWRLARVRNDVESAVAMSHVANVNEASALISRTVPRAEALALARPSDVEAVGALTRAASLQSSLLLLEADEAPIDSERHGALLRRALASAEQALHALESAEARGVYASDQDSTIKRARVLVDDINKRIAKTQLSAPK